MVKRAGLLVLAAVFAGIFSGICAQAAKDETKLPENIDLSERELPERWNKCQLCHSPKHTRFIPKAHELVRQHQDHAGKHGKGEVGCNNCHDANRSNYLRTSAEFPADFTNTSPVCERCHFEIFRDWKKGVHGKRIGHWNGEKVQSQCIDCHSPHQVTFKQMQASPPPKKPKLGVPKSGE
jgi:hypothetical protein